MQGSQEPGISSNFNRIKSHRALVITSHHEIPSEIKLTHSYDGNMLHAKLENLQ